MTKPSDATWTWQRGDLLMYVVEWRGHFNGYVQFPSRPLKEPGYGGVATYVPVHCGITYAEQNDDGTFTYGFDTAHACDDHIALKWPDNYGGRAAVEQHHSDIRNPEWLGIQCAMMADAIFLLAEIEDDYLLAEGNNERRASLLDDVWAKLSEKYKSMDTRSFGVLINLMSGQL